MWRRGNLLALGTIGFLTQEVELCSTIIVDARNVFNKLSHLAMLWTVRHIWRVGARFAFYYYNHLEKLLLRQLGDPPVTLFIQEGVTYGYPY